MCSLLSPIQPLIKTGTVEGSSAQETEVPTMDLNLLHPAIRDLILIPVEGDLP